MTYSTRSQAASGKLQWPRDPVTIQSESSERPRSLNEPSLVLSPRLARGNIVTFSEHASRSSDLGAAEDHNEDHGLSRSTPPPPPPSIPPPSTPPPPPEESRETQAQNRALVVAAVDQNSIRQSETQDQVGEHTPNQGMLSSEIIERGLDQETAKLNRWIKWLLTQNKAYETRNMDLEKKLKQYESMETDKDGQISRLQTERKQLISENMGLKKKLKTVSDFTARTDDLNSTIVVE